MNESEPQNVPNRASPGWSIASRLTLWYAASMFLLVVGSTAALYWVLVADVDRQSDRFLVDTVQILRGLIRERPDDLAALQQEVEWEGTVRRYARVYVRIRDAEGRPLLETPGASGILATQNLPVTPGGVEPDACMDIRSPMGTPYRALAASAPIGPDGRGAYFIEAALDTTAEQTLLRGYRTRAWLVLALALLASGVVGSLIARRGMRPIEAITETARGVRSSTLAARIPMGGLPSEVAGLASTINQMLTRLEDAFNRLSSFSADLAHELRTPISNLRGGVEVALAKPRDAVEYRAALESVLEECARLSQMIEGLMLVARADDPQNEIVRTPVDVDQELRVLVELFEPIAAETGLDIGIEQEKGEPLVVPLERSLFQRALSNLMTNALRNTPAGGRVRLSAAVASGALRVEVADTGPGIAAEHLDKVSDRFYRVDASRSSTSGGFGLGLAIVQSIMKVHGGTLEITSEQGDGARARLIFPFLAHDAKGQGQRPATSAAT